MISFTEGTETTIRLPEESFAERNKTENSYANDALEISSSASSSVVVESKEHFNEAVEPEDLTAKECKFNWNVFLLTMKPLDLLSKLNRARA